LFSSHFLLLAFFEKSHDWVFLEYQTFLKKIDPFQIPIQKTSSISFLCFQLKDTFLRFTFKPDIFYLKKIPSQMSILLVSELFNPKNSQPPPRGDLHNSPDKSSRNSAHPNLFCCQNNNTVQISPLLV
jgi:hypothetical protein